MPASSQTADTSGFSVLGWLAQLFFVPAAVIAVLVVAYFLPYAPAPAAAPLPSSTVKVILSPGHGSGVHIGNGYVVTAAHVAKDAQTVTLKMDNGKEQPATVLWVNKAYDIALLRNDATMSASHLDCRVATVGEALIARGNPAAAEFIAASGRVAGSEREFGPWKRVLITDMTTIPGMSGGGVFDAEGDVVGITVGVLVVPLGFAPSITGFGTIVPSAAVCDLLART
ncbi:serine protease [Corticibacterium sp. UT-5YL-CI-8]|nr:serine protease [Tianweitania sp. UT-5YL-CI-8]